MLFIKTFNSAFFSPEIDLLFFFQERYELTIRNSIVVQRVLDATADLPSNAITLKLDDSLWREILVGDKSAAWAFARGRIQVEGGNIAQVISMLGIFKE